MTFFFIVDLIILIVLLAHCAQSFKAPTEAELVPFKKALEDCKAMYPIGSRVHLLSSLGMFWHAETTVKKFSINYPYGIQCGRGLLWVQGKFAKHAE